VITIPLSRFIFVLKLAKEFDERYPEFDQTGWLLRNWSFEDTAAHYPAETDDERKGR